MKGSQLSSALAGAKITAPKRSEKSRQFAVVLPAPIVEFIENESARMYISSAAVLRQLIAKGIENDLENNPNHSREARS